VIEWKELKDLEVLRQNKFILLSNGDELALVSPCTLYDNRQAFCDINDERVLEDREIFYFTHYSIINQPERSKREDLEKCVDPNHGNYGMHFFIAHECIKKNNVCNECMKYCKWCGKDCF
jgi:hypothetical protein